MRIGDLIEAHHGERGVVVETEMMYPGNPHSPVRNLIIRWIDKPPRHAFGHKGTKISVFSAKVVSHANR